ncbi:growth hormone-inducible transmembrane protein [Gambusia affinis]|uniref:growth hormone-inducible transmembrane protein n=1 Tax=Gambusia affinis TaxID=33528 RepID=UPI001CDC6E3A|nr:growth hormone-inducible transmembrane protein [Gambusia affinis]
MLVARLTCLKSLPLVGLRPVLSQGSSALRAPTLKACPPLLRSQQGYASKARFGFRRAKTSREQLKEAAFEPATDTAIKSDCVMGAVIAPLTLRNQSVSRNPALMGLMMRGSWMAIGATFAAMIGAGMLVRSISYEHSPIPKHLAWMLHAGLLHDIMCFVAAVKFLNMGGPLAVGFGVVFASSLGSMFLPPTSAFGAGLYSVAVYGGLVLFSMFLLYDTQKVIKRAETHPLYAAQKYDPINA